MIRKGEVWGEPVVLDGTEPVAHTDADVVRLLAGGPRLVVLDGGDLYFSLGGRPSPEPMSLPIDLLEVTLDGGDPVLAAAHVVARRPRWSGPFAVGMNGTHLGTWNLGPKAHPNDGRVDVTRGTLTFRDRLAARRRAPTGSHVPHPALVTERVGDSVWTFEKPTPVRIDGVRAGSAKRVAIKVLPDRGSVVLAVPLPSHQ